MIRRQVRLLHAELARVNRGRIPASNDPGQLSLVLRVPYGVVACLAPWNYPYLLMVFKAAPALAAGNTLLLKGALETSISTVELADVMAAETPTGVVNVVAGGGEVGAAMVAHPAVDLVAFTGSTTAGRTIGAACAELTKPAHLELGGKDAAIVFDDVAPALAARAVVWASFLNSGQVCTSTERVYVHASAYESFVEHAAELAASLRVGDPMDEKTQIGPMRSERARKHVLDQLADAVGRGATIVTGGDVPPGCGYYLRPAVVTGVDHEMALMREETFGPVLAVMRFEDDDTAFDLAGDSAYGLGVSLYTADARRVRRAYEELAVGTVWVNDPVVDNLASPFGGVKASGNARELGIEALDAFTYAKHVHWNLDLRAKPWWYSTEE